MKPYPTNFKDLQLLTIPVGSLLRMENGATLTIDAHRQRTSGHSETFLQGKLDKPVDGYRMGLWFYNGKKFRAHHAWPIGMDIVAVLRRGP